MYGSMHWTILVSTQAVCIVERKIVPRLYVMYYTVQCGIHCSILDAVCNAVCIAACNALVKLEHAQYENEL